MDEIKNKNIKVANQAWRKKPRKFAPKSRLGCKTCKIRRVKCDLSRPSCLRCRSTGRTCDGYSEIPLALKTENTEIESSRHSNEKADTVQGYDSCHLCTMISAYQSTPEQWQVEYHGPILQNLGPLMILPYHSVKHLIEYQPCESWRDTLMFFSQTVPSVRCAAIALALTHRNYLDRHYSNRVRRSQSLKGWLPDKAALIHYNRAIQLLLSQESGGSIEVTAITLLVCYLFICFDHLAGNDVQAVNHLCGSVELSRSINKAIVNNSSTYDNANHLNVRTLICQVTRQIRRLDMQAVTFLVDWTPADIQDTLISQISVSGSTFRSLGQAADHLQILVARVMRLCNTGQQISPMGELPPLPSSLKDVVLEQLQTWSSLFKNILQQGSIYTADPKTYPLVSLLRLQHTAAWILLSVCGPGREMDYENFTPQFQQCVAWAGDVAAAHERFSGSLQPTFTPEIGLVPVLYLIGVKCRHPMVRREVLSILRRQPIREASWDSIYTARVVERVIEIEESGSVEEQVIQSMAQIPMWQRIEALSFLHVVSEQSAARLDITYTLCGQEGIHIESLII
ncbi:hypothetical protein BJX99DRAFT_250070 [Aspergillus californicus]